MWRQRTIRLYEHPDKTKRIISMARPIGEQKSIKWPLIHDELYRDYKYVIEQELAVTL